MVEMESITLNQRTFRGYYDALPDRKVSKAPKSAFVDQNSLGHYEIHKDSALLVVRGAETGCFGTSYD